MSTNEESTKEYPLESITKCILRYEIYIKEETEQSFNEEKEIVEMDHNKLEHTNKCQKGAMQVLVLIIIQNQEHGR
jgi:hypothetical protein